MIQIFGTIRNPLEIINPGKNYGGIESGGLALFLTNVIRLLIVLGGIYTLLNIIIAGYQFLAAGNDQKNIENAWAKIWQSMLGLIFIVASFVLAGIMGFLLFGDATAILSPRIFGP